jgi:4-hydroxy-tetrahydrodipicolinate synthase
VLPSGVEAGNKHLGTGDDFAVLLGRDTLIYAGLLHGARGSISATANVVPALVVAIYQAFVEVDMARALGAQNRLAPLRQAFGLGTFPVMVKEALELVGISAGPARSPVGPISPENREKLRQILQGLGLEPGRCRDDL